MKKLLTIFLLTVCIFFVDSMVYAEFDIYEECTVKGKCIGKKFEGICKCEHVGGMSGYADIANYSCNEINQFTLVDNDANKNYNKAIENYYVSKDYAEYMGDEYSVCQFFCESKDGPTEFVLAEDTSENTCKIVDMNEHEQISSSNSCWNDYTEDECGKEPIPNSKWQDGCCWMSYVCWKYKETDGTFKYRWSDFSPCNSSDMGYTNCSIVEDTDQDTCNKKNLSGIPDYTDPEDPDPNLPGKTMTCGEILGPIGRAIVKGAFTAFQIVAAIIAIVNGLIIVVPAVAAHDADALKKSTKKLVILGVVLVIALIFKPLVKLLGTILGFDVSCVL